MQIEHQTHTVIQFRSAFEETYEEWIWIMLYNLGFDFSQSSFVFQVLSITARDEKQCLLLVHVVLETSNTCEGKYRESFTSQI